MSIYWYVTHYIRKNYSSLYEKYKGKTVTFLFKDYDDLKNLRITDENNIIPTIHSVQDGLFEKEMNDFNFYKKIYFPLEDEYRELLQNYRIKTQNLSFDRKNNFDFNLEIYFEYQMEIFPDPEIDEAIIERIEEYIDKKEKIINEIQSQKKEQDQLRAEAKEILNNLNKIDSDDLENITNSFRKRMKSFETPDLNNLILNSLLTKLFLRGSEKALVYLRKNPFSIFPNIGNDLGRHFDYKEPISQDFMNFIVHLYRDKKISTLDAFIEKMVFYNAERRKEIKKILYTEDINLLEINYRCMFRAIDSDLPQSLKNKISDAYKTLENIDFTKLQNEEITNRTIMRGVYSESYKQELKKIKIDFIDQETSKDEYRNYLSSNETLEMKMKDIGLRFTDEELIDPITDFLKTTLSDNNLTYKKKDLVYNFLIRNDFEKLSELEPVIKEQIVSDINFDPQILQKIHFSSEELEELLHHPSFSIRAFAMGQFGKSYTDPEVIRLDTWPFQKVTPILIYKGTPQFLGYLAHDERIINKIESFNQDKFETIDNNKSVIALTQHEMMGLLTRANEYEIMDYEKLLSEKDENLEFYLLIDDKMTQTRTEYINRITNEANERIKNYRKGKENGNR